jgi:hypothetical protein
VSTRSFADDRALLRDVFTTENRGVPGSSPVLAIA